MITYEVRHQATTAAIGYAVNNPGITADLLRQRYPLDPQQADGIIETASHTWDEDAFRDKLRQQVSDAAAVVP